MALPYSSYHTHTWQAYSFGLSVNANCILANVVRSGEQVVQPVNTTTYRLTANAKGVSELLGSVQVAVDRSSCQINPGGNALSTIQGPIYANITGDLSFRDGSSPVVTFSPGRIRIQLHLSKQDAHKKMHELIQGIVELLNFYHTPPHGFRRQSVRIEIDNNGAGIIETTECPSAVLQQSAAISQVSTPPVLE